MLQTKFQLNQTLFNTKLYTKPSRFGPYKSVADPIKTCFLRFLLLSQVILLQLKKLYVENTQVSLNRKSENEEKRVLIESGANDIKKFTPSLGIPSLGVQTPRQE